MNVLPSDQTDGVLMERVRSNDHEALDVLVQRHWSPLVGYSNTIVGSVDTAEDIAQETFVRLWDNRHRWKAGGSLRAYLFRTARNLGLGRVRHLEVRRRTEPDIRSGLQTGEPSPLDTVVTDELREALRLAVEKLAPRRREALVLVRFQGLSLDEAAERMGLSRQTVANHISLALDALEVSLRDFNE